jgi:hypothetical protein
MILKVHIVACQLFDDMNGWFDFISLELNPSQLQHPRLDLSMPD